MMIKLINNIYLKKTIRKVNNPKYEVDINVNMLDLIKSITCATEPFQREIEFPNGVLLRCIVE